MKKVTKLLCLASVIAGSVFAKPPSGVSCGSIVCDCLDKYGAGYSFCWSLYNDCVERWG